MNVKSEIISTKDFSRDTQKFPMNSQKVLKSSAAFWFITAMIGQWMFAYYIAVFYGGSTLAGDFEKWNTVLYAGIVSGDLIGNLILGLHLLVALVITAGGPLQLMPQVRKRFMNFHRWNGRVYIIIAFLAGISGLYMTFFRNVLGGPLNHIGITINASLIMYCSYMSWRKVLQKDIVSHRTWAIRAFLMVSGVWFMRVGYGLWFFIFGGKAPGITKKLDGPFDIFLAFAISFIPLAFLELYLQAEKWKNPSGKIIVATIIFVLSVATGLGIFMAFGLPLLQ